MRVNIEILKVEELWHKRKAINKRLVKKIIIAALKATGKFEKCSSIETAILLTDNEKMAELNHQFLGKNEPTNVLSFPDQDLDFKTLSASQFQGDVYLGDIAMSYELINGEAKSFFINFENHFTHLLVHAILHLIGYDHENGDADAAIMEALEIKILNKLGIKKPPLYA